MISNYFQNKKNSFILLFLLSISFLYFIKLIILSNGYAINQYPFISPDGFDWLTEGLYLSEAIKGNLYDGVLPVARPPVFIFITALDAFWGQTGVVIWLFNSIAFFITGYVGLLLIKYKEQSTWFNIIFLVALLLAPINYVRLWMLSDSITVALSLATVYYLYKHQDFNSLKQIILASFLIAIAGSSQIYGLMFPLIYIGTLFLFSFSNKKIVKKQIIFLVVLSLVIYAILNYLWFNFIPHGMTPKNFVLLKLSFDMFWFYFHTWGFYFFPFLPLLFLIGKVKKKEYLQDIFLVSLWIAVIVFMTLCFIYQWQESRFTFMFWYILVIAIFRSSQYIEVNNEIIRLKIYTIVSTLIILQTFFMSIPNEWRPDLKHISISPASWMGSLMVAKPVDRFELDISCDNVKLFCNDAIVSGDDYIQSVMDVYKIISLGENKEKININAENIIEPIIQKDKLKYFNIEYLNQKAQNGNLLVLENEILNISGWIFDNDFLAFKKVNIVLSEINSTNEYKIGDFKMSARGDVANAFGSDRLKRTGFSFEANISSLPKGSYEFWILSKTHQNQFVKYCSHYILEIK